MIEDRDRNLVRETCEVLKALNKKIEECARLDIRVELAPGVTRGKVPLDYRASFTRMETILPATFDNEQDAAEAMDNGRNTGGKSYWR